MKITDALVSALIKRGIVYEARNVDLDFKIPVEGQEGIAVNFKCDNMTLRLEKCKDEKD